MMGGHRKGEKAKNCYGGKTERKSTWAMEN